MYARESEEKVMVRGKQHATQHRYYSEDKLEKTTGWNRQQVLRNYEYKGKEIRTHSLCITLISFESKKLTKSAINYSAQDPGFNQDYLVQVTVFYLTIKYFNLISLCCLPSQKPLKCDYTKLFVMLFSSNSYLFLLPVTNSWLLTGYKIQLPI